MQAHRAVVQYRVALTTRIPRMSLHAADTASLLERVESLEAENRLLRRLLEQHQHAPADRERDQRRLEAAENLSRIGTWEWSADAREAQVSRGLRRLLGLADDAPTPTIRRLLTYLPPVDRQRAIILLRRLRADNPGMRLRAAGMAEFDERRRLTRLFIVVQDITAVWSEARARRHLELRWHYLINTCPDAVFIARLADGRIVDCNDAAARLTGRCPARSLTGGTGPVVRPRPAARRVGNDQPAPRIGVRDDEAP